VQSDRKQRRRSRNNRPMTFTIAVNPALLHRAIGVVVSCHSAQRSVVGVSANAG